MQHPVHATSLLVHLARLYTYVHKYYGRRILHSVLCRSAPFIFAGQSNTPGALVRRWQISSPAKWFWECVVHCQCRVSARAGVSGVWWVCMNNEHACVLWSFVCMGEAVWVMQLHLFGFHSGSSPQGRCFWASQTRRFIEGILCCIN